jgi:hypothetical protein
VSATARKIKPPRNYPRGAEIKRAVDAAKACGIDVAGFEVCPDGTIRIVEARTVPVARNDFDRWESLL